MSILKIQAGKVPAKGGGARIFTQRSEPRWGEQAVLERSKPWQDPLRLLYKLWICRCRCSIVLTNSRLIVMILNMLRNFIDGILNLIYPQTCIVCKIRLNGKSAIDHLVCMQCWQKIKRNIPPFCHCCGRHLEELKFNRRICPSCIKRKLHFDRAFSPCVYEGVIKELIHQFKYKNKDYLGLTLSRLMIEFIKEYNLPLNFIDAIIPVPLYKVRLREREFNQAEILSKYVAGEFNKELLNGVLLRQRNTKMQTQLKDEERLLNVKGSFSVPDDKLIKGKNVLLVDDVLTTASTSSEAAYALKHNGAKVVFVLTLAN